MMKFKLLLLVSIVSLSTINCYSQNRIQANNLYELINNIENDMGWINKTTKRINKRMKHCVPKDVCSRIYSSDTICVVLYPDYIADVVPFFLDCIYGKNENFIYDCYRYAGISKELARDSDSYFKNLMNRMAQIDTISEYIDINQCSYDEVTFLKIVHLQGSQFQYYRKDFLQQRMTDKLFLIATDKDMNYR